MNLNQHYGFDAVFAQLISVSSENMKQVGISASYLLIGTFPGFELPYHLVGNGNSHRSETHRYRFS